MMVIQPIQTTARSGIATLMLGLCMLSPWALAQDGSTATPSGQDAVAEAAPEEPPAAAEGFGTDQLDALAAEVQKHLPGIRISDLGPSAVEGLYELVTDGTVYYVDASGQHLIDGDLIDLGNRINLTEQRLGTLHYSLIAALDDADFLTYPGRGPNASEGRSMTVFTDISCGYCRKLHQEIDTILDAGISVRYLMFPRAGLGTDAHKDLESSWCADNPQQALTDAKAGKTIEAQNCDNPIEQHVALAERLGLRGTPLIYLDTGARIPGYRKAVELIAMIKAGEPMTP